MDTSIYTTSKMADFISKYCAENPRTCYKVDLFYAKPHDEVMMKNGFAKWLDEQFRKAHSSAREMIGTDHRRQIAFTGR